MVSPFLRSLRWMLLLEGKMQAAQGSSERTTLSALRPCLRTGLGQAAATPLAQGVHLQSVQCACTLRQHAMHTRCPCARWLITRAACARACCRLHVMYMRPPTSYDITYVHQLKDESRWEARPNEGGGGWVMWFKESNL